MEVGHNVTFTSILNISLGLLLLTY